MPWRGPEYDGEFPSLGWEVLDWLAGHLIVPDGPLAGQPLELTDEQAAILVRFYGVDDRGRWLFRRGAVRRAQGWGKSPLLAGIALAELCGPTRFGGWDARGEPVAVRPVAPWVQIAAVSEDQTDNTYAAMYAMAQESDLAGTEVDIGLTRMFLIGGTGRIEPVTASAGSRLGQRITFAVLDETHLWTSRNGGHRLVSTIRRNASKMGGRTFESTNAPAIGEDSVAERTLRASEKGAPGLLYDSEEAPFVEDLHDRAAVLDALRVSYGDAVRWINLERLADEVADPGTDPSDAYRFYFNLARSTGECPFDIPIWETLAAPGREIEPGEVIGLGFDGSISDDWTALYGATRDGHVFKVKAWSRPAGASADWRIPRGDVHETVARVFDRWKVGRMLADPPKWWTELDQWADLYGEDVVGALDTNQKRRFAPACDRFATSIRERAVTHDGDKDLTAHLAACKRVQVRIADDDNDGRTPFVVDKADTRKIDCAVAAILALEAAMTMELVEVGVTSLW